jgi:hypothetical protein
MKIKLDKSKDIDKKNNKERGRPKDPKKRKEI